MSATLPAVSAPFPPQEYDDRLARLRERMAADGLSALLLVAPENIYYLAGLNHQGYFAFTMLVVPLDGPLRIVARAMEATTIRVWAPQCEHRPFADYEDPAQVAFLAVRDSAPAGSRIGVEKSTMWFPFDVWERLQEALRGYEIVDGGGRVEALRAIKSPAEIAYVREAAAASSRAMEAGLAAVHVGATQTEVAAAVYTELIRAGSEAPGFPPLIRSRRALLQEHVTWSAEQIEPGDAVFLELSASAARYHAPLTRMAYLGEPPAGTDEAAAIALAGLEAIRSGLQPGVRGGDVYDRWQRVVDEGLGHDRYRRHHCGYLVGIGFPPSWVGGASVVGLRAGGQLEIREGMTFHVLSWLLGQEPADYVLSDTVLVTSHGGEILTTAPRTPIVVS